MVSQPHNSKLTIELLKDFKNKQEHDYGLTTTQQQSHNRQPAGFKSQQFKLINQTLTKSTLDLIVFE